MCYVKHLKKVPGEVKKALLKGPMHTPQEKQYDVQVSCSKMQADSKVPVLQDETILSFWDSSNEHTAQPTALMITTAPLKDKGQRYHVTKANFS